MKICSATDIGQRQTNEDNFAIEQKERETLLLVCDGMGGHNSGELASKMACDSIVKAYHLCNHFESVEAASLWLAKAIKEAHNRIKRYAYANEAHAGMGTTLVCALIYENKLLIANIGDSRCYYINREDIQLLTTDDTFVNELVKNGLISKEQAKTHEKKNILMKAVGVSDSIEVKVDVLPLQEGYILLCSDGLYNGISERQMKEILYTKDDLSRKTNAMIMLSNRQGGKDNVTVVVAYIERGDLQ